MPDYEGYQEMLDQEGSISIRDRHFSLVELAKAVKNGAGMYNEATKLLKLEALKDQENVPRKLICLAENVSAFLILNGDIRVGESICKSCQNLLVCKTKATSKFFKLNNPGAPAQFDFDDSL